MARDQLAGKEMQIGRYYLERREYIAAIKRFQHGRHAVPGTRHVEEALERLAEANLAMGLAGEAQTAAAVLGHNFPDSRWYKDAYRLLQKKGVLRRANNGGAVSDAFGEEDRPERRRPRGRHARRPCDPRHRPDRSARSSISRPA